MIAKRDFILRGSYFSERYNTAISQKVQQDIRCQVRKYSKTFVAKSESTARHSLPSQKVQQDIRCQVRKYSKTFVAKSESTARHSLPSQKVQQDIRCQI